MSSQDKPESQSGLQLCACPYCPGHATSLGVVPKEPPPSEAHRQIYEAIERSNRDWLKHYGPKEDIE